jgi:hypothetical protein
MSDDLAVVTALDLVVARSGDKKFNSGIYVIAESLGEIGGVEMLPPMVVEYAGKGERDTVTAIITFSKEHGELPQITADLRVIKSSTGDVDVVMSAREPRRRSWARAGGVFLPGRTAE